MKILEKVVEEVLKIILEQDIEPNNFVLVSYNLFPEYMVNNIDEYLDDLKNSFYIASYSQTLEDVGIYLTQEGMNYFKNKKIEQFPQNAMELLKNMMLSENPEDYTKYLFNQLDAKRDSRLRSMMRKLKEDGYIDSSWADNIPYIINFNEKAYELEENGFCMNKQEGKASMYNVKDGNIYINSVDESTHIVNNNSNSTELFERMIDVVLNSQIDKQQEIIESIKAMKEHSAQPTFIGKYHEFLGVAANYMTIFAPFLPALGNILTRIN